MSSPWALVTPASRGIGFQIARRLLQTTKLPVVATVRREESKTKDQILEGLDVDEARLDVINLDFTDEESIKSAAAFTKDKFRSSYLHLAYALPGILHPEKSPSKIDATQALDTLRINLLGPMLLAKHFTPQMPSRSTELARDLQADNTSDTGSVPQLATFAVMAARVGSISDNRAGGWYSYRASKSGVMQLAKSLNIYLQMSTGGKAISVALHPGTVKTGLSKDFWGSVKKEKLFEADFAAERLVDVVSKLDASQGGRIWDWAGKEIEP